MEGGVAVGLAGRVHLHPGGVEERPHHVLGAGVGRQVQRGQIGLPRQVLSGMSGVRFCWD